MHAAAKYCINDCQYLIGCPSKSIIESLTLTTHCVKSKETGNFTDFAFIYRYSTDDLVGDLVAGITVGLTVIPQALAYAGIAGLDPAVSFAFLILFNS